MIQPGPLSAAAIQVDHVPPVVDLDAEVARRADVVGAKAAAVARAAPPASRCRRASS